jgi:hypothetical protein
MVHHVYEGRRRYPGGPPEVTCDGFPFVAADSLKVCNHSPNGFEWGYGGSGPAQLALALLLEVCVEETAVELHQEFKWCVVSSWQADHWRVSTRELVEWVRQRALPVDCLRPESRE